MSKEGVLAFGPALKQSKTIVQMSIYYTMVEAYFEEEHEANSNDEIKEAMEQIGHDLKDHNPRIDMSTEASIVSKELDLEMCVIMWRDMILFLYMKKGEQIVHKLEMTSDLI